jgi:hypothetical protein
MLGSQNAPRQENGGMAANGESVFDAFAGHATIEVIFESGR